VESTNSDTDGELLAGGPSIRAQIGARLREALWSRFGEEGALAACEKVGVSTRTMLDYEAGAAMPPETLLRFLVLLGINPAWLLNGRGPQFVRSRLRLNGPVRAGREPRQEDPTDEAKTED
jgi:hypothetical protein